MKIELKCTCGASAVFNDERGSFINPGGHPDDKGRIYRVEIMADKWLANHRRCIKSPVDFTVPRPTSEEMENLLLCHTKMINEQSTEQREEVVRAFLAKYNCQPNEIEQVFQDGIWFLRKIGSQVGL